MKSQFTPGPWTAWGYTIYTDAGLRVAQTWEQERCCLPTPTMEANARLIAAAPELLAALERLLESAEYLKEDSDSAHGYHGEPESFKLARAAIAKAKGLANDE